MPSQELKSGTDWRRGREDYLRASGRHEELIMEAYETSGTDAKLVIIPGGGKRSTASDLGIPPFVAKRAVS